ncbi:MAG: hypothetical protein QOI96_283 [Verrucomicrobiota bacterium]
MLVSAPRRDELCCENRMGGVIRKWKFAKAMAPSPAREARALPGPKKIRRSQSAATVVEAGMSPAKSIHAAGSPQDESV